MSALCRLSGVAASAQPKMQSFPRTSVGADARQEIQWLANRLHAMLPSVAERPKSVIYLAFACSFATNSDFILRGFLSINSL
jgi:hypothetical protein